MHEQCSLQTRVFTTGPHSLYRIYVLTKFLYSQTHFFSMKYKPILYAGIAAVSLTILTGLTIAVIMMPIFVVFSPILVPAIIASSLLATGFIASGSLGTMGIALLLWLYKREDLSGCALHARGVRPEGANKLSGGDDSPLVKDKPLKEAKTAEEDKPPGENKSPVEDKPPQKEKSIEGDNPVEDESIPKVKLVEQKRIGPTYYGPSILTKKSLSSRQFRLAKDANRGRSIFMKEYQKVPRVGAFACEYFTSRDKFT